MLSPRSQTGMLSKPLQKETRSEGLNRKSKHSFSFFFFFLFFFFFFSFSFSSSSFPFPFVFWGEPHVFSNANRRYSPFLPSQNASFQERKKELGAGFQQTSAPDRDLYEAVKADLQKLTAQRRYVCKSSQAHSSPGLYLGISFEIRL